MRRRSADPSERGASAVEFALVAPLLFGLLFGIVDYGLYFADVVTVQQGLGDAARTATLAPADTSGPQWGSATCALQQDSGGGGAQLEHLACSVLRNVDPAAGQLSVRAKLVDSSGRPTLIWAPGNRLRLCGLTDHPPVLPFVPLPSGGKIQTRVDMPVQAVPGQVLMAAVQSPVPAGTDWSWC